MANSPRLAFPYIAESQNAKYITHNGALDRLDALVQTAVIDRDLTSPPGSPAEGSMYIVGGSPSGAWSGHANHLAEYIGATWAFYEPAEGWKAWVADEDLEAVFDGSAWVTLSAPGGGYTDEQAQDAVGGILTDGSTIDLTYNDAGPSITAEVKDASLAAGKLASGVLVYDVGATYVGAPPTSEAIVRYPFPRAVDFPSGLTNSRGVCGTAPSAQTDFDLRKGGVSFGTMRFAASGTTASFIAASPTSFSAGDVLTVVTPANLNGLEDLGFSLAGVRA